MLLLIYGRNQQIKGGKNGRNFTTCIRISQNPLLRQQDTFDFSKEKFYLITFR